MTSSSSTSSSSFPAAGGMNETYASPGNITSNAVGNHRRNSLNNPKILASSSVETSSPREGIVDSYFSAWETNNNNHGHNKSASLWMEQQQLQQQSFGLNTSLLIHKFLPDFTEHPKPKPKPRKTGIPPKKNGGGEGRIGEGGNSNNTNDDDANMRFNPKAQQRLMTGGSNGEERNAGTQEQDEVTFTQDFVAGGVAGSASVIVGHPLDTIKVRVQNSSAKGSVSIMSTIREFGGVSSLFRGMGAPLSAAAAINAVVFSCYGIASKFWDSRIAPDDSAAVALLAASTAAFSETNHNHVTSLDAPNAATPLASSAAYSDGDFGVEYDVPTHDPWQKAMVCGSFAGLVQCTIICPMEHVKCRLQVQQAGAGAVYKGPFQATQSILRNHGFTRLYQGWWVTALREVPAFGAYFAIYDYVKDMTNTFLAKQAGFDPSHPSYTMSMNHTHTWVASALAGGIAGSTTWLIAYPVDVIKTRIQTSPLDTPLRQLNMWHVGKQIVLKYGWRHMFRGLGITLIRAFPVNGTIFPVYEMTLMQMNKYNIS